MQTVASSLRRTTPNSVGAASSISEQIAQGALEQFSEVGIRRSSVEDVARRAGIARVTVYRRVGGKEDLVRLVIEREASRAMDELDGALAGEQIRELRSSSVSPSSCASPASTRSSADSCGPSPSSCFRY